MGFLAGKRALIVGVATDRSIAWGIAEAMHREGAELAFTCANDRFKDRVEPLAASIGSDIVLPLDVTSDAQIDAAFAALGERWDGLDILVHAVAFAPREALAGVTVLADPVKPDDTARARRRKRINGVREVLDRRPEDKKVREEREIAAAVRAAHDVRLHACGYRASKAFRRGRCHLRRWVRPDVLRAVASRLRAALLR